MKSDYENQLEAAVDSRLKRLGDLAAPPTLVPRVWLGIELAKRPWHQRSWEAWPLLPRATMLIIFLAMFGGLCFGIWKLAETWLPTACALGRAVIALVNIPETALGHSGVRLFRIAIVVILLAWMVCLGLGTACVRLAMRPSIRIEHEK